MIFGRNWDDLQKFLKSVFFHPFLQKNLRSCLNLEAPKIITEWKFEKRKNLFKSQRRKGLFFEKKLPKKPFSTRLTVWVDLKKPKI